MRSPPKNQAPAPAATTVTPPKKSTPTPNASSSPVLEERDFTALTLALNAPSPTEALCARPRSGGSRSGVCEGARGIRAE
ncbi:MAG: hypothetical protein U0263_33245 [Polyangiaceae bacterium]